MVENLIILRFSRVYDDHEAKFLNTFLLEWLYLMYNLPH
jgi:hypothetical protein